MNHYIAKQTINLQLKNAQTANELQQEVNQLYYSAIAPRLEALFDRLSHPSELVRIDRLEVDLGKISRRQLERKEFIPQLLEQLEAQLQELVQSPTEEVTRMPIARSQFERWLYFLEHGFLPWLYEQPKADWSQEVLATLGLEATAIASFRHLMARSPQAMTRLLKQHDPAFLIAIAELCTGRKQKKLEAAKAIIKSLAAKESGITPETQQSRDKLSLKAKEDNADSTNKEDPSEADQFISALLSGEKTIPGFNIRQEGRKTAPSTPSPPQEAIDRYVYHAGAVLLHPFLLTYFAKFDLLQDDDFKDEASRQKAVHLLHFLATGATEAPEYELVLPKLLCGLPLEIPLERASNITKEEQAEGNNLLLAAVEHWGALGDVSEDALREGFLRRSGKLSFRQNGQLLQVEAHAIDLLLDKLPWNLSMIKLPWMPEILRVEWGKT